MFERFTDRARRVLVLAQEEARDHQHPFIGTEHVLLGLIREGEGVASRALGNLGVTYDAVHAAIEETRGTGATLSPGSPPFTPRTKKVLELALREALQLGHNFIGTEHLLLGLIREGEGVAVGVLADCGVSTPDVRTAVIEIMRVESTAATISTNTDTKTVTKTVTKAATDFAAMVAHSRAAHRVLEIEYSGATWGLEDHLHGLVGEVGDLARSIARHPGDSAPNSAVAADLAGCLWSLYAVADEAQVDLTTAFYELLAGFNHVGRHEATPS